MKNIFLASIVFLLSASSYSQPTYFYITGKVINADTKLPMQAASVFAQNTTLGTATDAEGYFKLMLPNGGYDLVISFSGFATESKRISTVDADDKNIVIELKQKEKVLEDVAVVSTSEVKDGLEKYGWFFIEQFIGKTDNSKNCIIKNKEALKFYFSKKRNRLKVLATEPIIIENNALGYNIKYDLDSFTYEYATQQSLYTGFPLFEEMVPISNEQKMQWEKLRKQAYKGSVLHFMRSIYQKKLKENDFEIQFIIKYSDKEMGVPLKDFYAALNYRKDDSTQIVSISPNQNNIGVIYTKEKPVQSFLNENPNEPSEFQFSILSVAPQQSFFIEQNGYFFEQNNITINEYLSWFKLADAVPYDYNEEL